MADISPDGTADVPEAAADTVDDDILPRLEALHDRLHLRDLRVQRIYGEVFADLPLAVGSLSISMEDPEVLIEPPRFACRFVHRVKLLDGESERLAEVETALLVDFEIEGPEPPDPEAVRTYVEKNAFFLAYPYIREAVQSTTLKLGLDPLVLGILSRGDERPSEVILVPRSVDQPVAE